jgi:hypothetical protein
MITVLIRVMHGPEALAMTLSALVPAVADGLVADAIILAAEPGENIAGVAEAAGATLVTAADLSWKEGARQARHPWLLCLEDGDLPQEGWIRVLDRFVSLHGERHRRARLRRRQGLLAATRGAARALWAPTVIRAGDLVRRDLVLGDAQSEPAVYLAATIERDPAFS